MARKCKFTINGKRYKTMNPIAKLSKVITDKKLWEGTIELQRNDFLKRENTIDTNVYFIKNGSLRIFVLDDNNEHTIRFGYTNNIITALDSFFSETPSDLIVQALKATTVHYISKKQFLNFIFKDEEYTALWNSLLSGLILQQMERERDLLTSSPIERYKRVLKRSPVIFQEIPHKYIASYLRMTPETLSRLKKS